MSPKAKARLGGALYLVTIVGGIVAQAFIGDRLVVTGDAAATARNILANPTLVRVAYAIFMIEMACQTAMTAVMYDLLMPVDRSLARTAAVFGYVGSGIKAMARLFFSAPLFVLGGASYLAAFDARQLEALAYLLPIVLFALIGCAVTIGWLLVRGVDEKRWYEMAAASSSSIWR